MSHCPIEYIRHMLDEIEYIEQTKAGMDKYNFINDETLKRSFVRSIEIIGEAAKKLPNSFRQEHSDIAWQRIAGMRDKLIHAYFGIDYGLVWDVAEHSLPELKKQLLEIMKEK